MRNLPTTYPFDVVRCWNNETVAIIGSGYSINKTDVIKVCNTSWKIIGVNDAYKLCARMDILYATDAKWWRYHWDNLKSNSSQKPLYLTAHYLGDSLEPAYKGDLGDIAELKGMDKEGLSLDPNIIHYGHSSGFAALNVAVLTGAKKIVLVGFDYNSDPLTGKVHWFGDHPKEIQTSFPFVLGVTPFRQAIPQLKELNVTVYRTNLNSALTMFPYKELEWLIL